MTRARDVAIVGGGAVGLLLACLLAQRGADVVVLERKGAPSTGSRAIGIHPPGLRALDAVGVGDAVRREGAPIRVGVASSRGRELARLPFARASIVSLPQHRTESLLRQRLAALAPRALRWDERVVALEQRPASVALTLEGGGRVDAAWAVGADGVRSEVRGLLGATWLERPGTAAYAMADAPDDTGAPDAALLHLEPGGIVESFPMPHGSRRWVARLAAPRERMTVAELQATLDERLVAAPRLPPDAAVSAFTARQRRARPIARGRAVLVGDAAHEVSPIGGQGMSLGWLDALALDRALAGAGDEPRALAGYARARSRPTERAMRRAAWNMAMGAPASGVELRTRLALVRALALPPARSILLRSFTMRGL